MSCPFCAVKFESIQSCQISRSLQCLSYLLASIAHWNSPMGFVCVCLAHFQARSGCEIGLSESFFEYSVIRSVCPCSQEKSMPRITLTPVQLVFLIPIRSAPCLAYLLFLRSWFLFYLMSHDVCLQMCWSQFLCSLVSLPISIFPTVENTG